VTATLAKDNGRVATGSPSERFTSRDPNAFPEPSGRDEVWRFSPLTKLRALLDAGACDARLRWSHRLPEGVDLIEVPAGDPSLAVLPEPVDKLAAFAAANAGGATKLRVRAGAEIAEPIIVDLTGEGTDRPVWGHLVVEAEANAHAIVVLLYRGSAHYAAQTSVLVGDGAELALVQVMDWNADTLHVDHIGAALGRDATYRHTSVSLGGAVVRLSPTVDYRGPGSRAELMGVSFAGSGQHFESRLYVDHSMPECSSDVLYKNALLGESSRTVWIGDVRIRPAATGTRTYEMNRNLLLSVGARADSVPNLEIETGEIAGAGHASATGRFDDLQLFYLESRGIDADQARRLVVRGFFADVVDRIGIPDLQRTIMTAVEARLGFAADDGEDRDESQDHDVDNDSELENTEA
jgi:Fe-S cluster assembly protein SufD